MNESIGPCEGRAGKKMDLVYTETNRIGDHIWYISDTRKLQSHDPSGKQINDLPGSSTRPSRRGRLASDLPHRRPTTTR